MKIESKPLPKSKAKQYYTNQLNSPKKTDHVCSLFVYLLICLWMQAVQHTWERNGFTDVFCTSNKGYHTLDTDTETTVWY